jgi:two-component system LytT family response regulator
LDAGFGKEPIEQLYVRDRGRSRRVPVDSIVRVEAADDYARIVTVDGSSFLVSARMKGLAACLDTNRFVRVHRSLIVNAERIETITDAGNGRRVLTMSDGTTCPVSRSGAARLRALLANRGT